MCDVGLDEKARSRVIVIDVGCATYGGDESINYLVEKLSPLMLFGFDPDSRVHDRWWWRDGTLIVTERSAAWTHAGTVGFIEGSLSGRVDDDGTQVRCFDLADFILSIPKHHEITLKMDAEKAEYVLLPYLVERGASERLALAWVEWHCPSCGYGRYQGNDTCAHCGYHEKGRRAMIEDAMGCPMAQWDR